MPRAYILGNGSVLATFDERLQLRDLYYPHVGMEDHTTFGNVHRWGVFVEGRGFAWMEDASWSIQYGYKLDTLVTESTARNEKLGITMTVEDCVHPVSNILLRRFTIRSLDGQEKRVRVFFNHNLHIYGDTQKDTAFYEPYTNSIIHFRQSRYFLVGGETNWAQECPSPHVTGQYASVLRSMRKLSSCGLTSFATGKANYRGLTGTWKDAEDGELGRNPIEQGSVDSTVGIHCIVAGDSETDVHLWLCIGKSLEEVVSLQERVHEETPERLFRNCNNYWKSWVHKAHRDFGSLSGHAVDLFKRSLLLIRMHADKDGGLLAAADSDIMLFNRDTYTYVWPRDGAFVSMALDHAGYNEVTRRFFEFCARIMPSDGYLMHKYNPDGSPGSSWHPWFRDGEAQLPIQEDETALVIHALWKHFEQVQDFEFLQDMYERIVKKAARFLCDFREKETGLPLHSYDPWEEHRGIFTYTTCCTIAGLNAAARIAHILGHYRHSEHYQQCADEMRQALLFHLYDESAGRFVKKIKRKDGNTIERDLTPDASIGVVWSLGILSPDDPRVVSTMNQLHEMLSVKEGIGGLARYTTDYYHASVEPSDRVPGNPWVITTLWDAQWRIITAKTLEDLERPRSTLQWTLDRANSAGVLPEQMHPYTGAPLSVAPLTWSHATYVETVLLFTEKEQELKKRS